MLYVVRYERCRSTKGVPMALVPLETSFYGEHCDEVVIADVIDIFARRALVAHPDEPAMQMPSNDPGDYALTDKRLRDATPDDTIVYFDSVLYTPKTGELVVEAVLQDA